MNGKISTLLNAKDEIRSKRITLSEKTLSYISELAEVLCDEAGEDEIFFRDETFIKRYRALTEQVEENAASPVNEMDVKTLEKQLNETEKALLCLCLSDILGIKGISGSGTFFDDPPKASGETVSYIKSRASDDAYLLFASKMSDPRVSYAHDLNEVCESVLYGKTAYGIIPTVNLRSLMLKYGLKTAKRIKVKNQDGTYTYFAFVKKDLDIPSSDKNAYFEFSVKTNDPSRILLASDACSMTAVNISYSSEEQTLTATLKIADDGFCGFLTYLSLNYPDFIPYGIYEEI